MSLIAVAAVAVAVAMAPQALPAQSHLFTPDRYAALQHISAPKISPDGKTVAFTRWHVDTTADQYIATLSLVDATGGRQRDLGAGHDPQWSPDGRRLAYLDDSAGVALLSIRNADGSGEVAHLATASAAFRWSPDGKWLAFATSSVKPDSVASAADVVTTLDAPSMHLAVIAAAGGEARDITPSFRLTGTATRPGFDWLPDGRGLLVEGMEDSAGTARPSHPTIVLVDLASASRRPFLSENWWWANPLVAPDGKSVALLGIGRNPAGATITAIYTARIDGAELHAVSPELDREPQSLAWSDKETLWFTTDERGARNSWSVVTTAKVPVLRPGSNGVHQVTLGDVTSRGDFGVVVRSSPSQPEELYRFALKKPTAFTVLTHVNDGFLASLHLGDVEEVGVKSPDGASVQGWLLKPPDFELNRKWPLLVRLANGPHRMAAVGFSAESQALAAGGTLVLTLNPHGASGYGPAFDAIDPDSLPAVAARDVWLAIDAVIGNGYVDTARIVVEGNTLAAWLLGGNRHFKAGILVASEDPPLYEGSPWSWVSRWPLAAAGWVTTPTLLLLDAPPGTPSRSQLEALFPALQARGVRSEPMRFRGAGTPAEWKKRIAAELSWIRGQ